MPNDRRLYPLCSCSIGIWRTPGGSKPYLLLLHDQRRFVLLLVREHEPQARPADHALSVNSLLCSARQQASSWWRHKNPFSDHEAAPGADTQQVLAFELEWSVVEGIDFRWPLTDDARLVLEAAVIRKRLFQDVEEVCHYYQPQPRGARRARISTLQQLAAADKEQQQQQQASLQLQPHPRAAAGCSGSAVGPGAAGCGRQQQQQQSGAMSRVSSWASWASWTSGGQTPTVLNSADREPGAAATALGGSSSQRSSGAFAWHQQPAYAAATARGSSSQRSSGAFAWHQQPAAAQDAPDKTVFGFEPLQQPAVGQQQQQQQCGSPRATDGALQAAAATASQAKGACSGRCSPGSPCTAAGTQCHSVLISLPSLSAGIAADSQVAAAACEAAAAAAAEPASSLGPPRGFRHRLTVSVGAAAAAASADAGEQGGGSSWHEECGSIEEEVVGPGPTCQDDINVRPGSFNFFPRQLSRLGRGSAAGCATAPCSAPSSPRVAALGHDAAAAAAAAEHQQHHAAQQMQRLQQVCQRLEQPSAQGRQQQFGSRKGVAVGRTNSSSSSKAADRQATPHDRACPLCNQPLLQPLNVLQQRFHQQQHSQQQRQGGRLGSSKSSGSAAAAAAARSKSACSLEQLLQQSKAAAAQAAQATELRQQQQQPASSSSCPELCQQQQQQQVSPRSLAGMAAAAVGSLAARCAGQGGSKDGGSSSCATAKPAAAAAADGSSAARGDGVQPTLSAAGSGELATAEIVPAAAKACSEVAGTSTGSLAAGSSAVAPPPAAELVAGADTTGQPAAGGSSSAQPTAPQQQRPPGEYRCRTVVLTFRDPSLPHQLKRFVGSEVRLLKLYESGLPGWAVLLPSLGLWYRPWLRRLTWLLFVVLSVVSMAMGFYDLYKNVPYFKTAMVAAFRPAAAVFEWLEGHTQIRLSILLTYMLGKSQLLMQLLRLLTHTSLKPILEPLAALLAPLAAAASAVAATASWLAQPFLAAGRLLHALLLGPLGRLAWLLAQLVWQLLALLLWSGPVQLLAAVGQAVAAAGQGLLLPLRALLLPLAGGWRSGLAAARATGQVARGAASAVPAVARSGKAGAAVLKSSASAAASSSAWLWSPLEALEVLRVSTLRLVKSLQAVLRFFVALGSTVNQHRLSLGLTLRSKVRGGLRAAAGSPAGRVASAVAVKMGQEQRLARLQQRLARQDSGLTLSGAGSGLLLGGRGGGGGSLAGSLATGGGAAGEGEGEGECSLVSSMDGGGGSAAAGAGVGSGTAAGARRRSRGIGRGRLDEEDGEAEVMSPLSAGLLSADEDEEADEEEEEDRDGGITSSSRDAAAGGGSSHSLQLFASAAGLRHRAAGHGNGSGSPAWADVQQQQHPGSFDAAGAGPGPGWRPSSSSSRHMSASPPLLLHLQQRQAAAQAALLLRRGSGGAGAAAAAGGGVDPLLRHSVDAAAWLRGHGSASLGRHGRSSVGQWGGFPGRLQDDHDDDAEEPFWADPSAAFASAPEQGKTLPLWPPCGSAAGFDAWQQQQQQLMLFQQQQQGVPGGAGQSGWSSSAGLLMLPARRVPQPATAIH